MNIIKKYVERKVEKTVRIHYECLSEGKSNRLKADMFFRYERDVIQFDCPNCKSKLSFSLGNYISDNSNKSSKSMHFSSKII